MRYISEDGEVIRVGLEIKSKQTSSSQTSEFSQRNGPKEDHVKQCVCYSIMYGTAAEPLDYYVILYVNTSHKAWNMDAEDFAKNPDIKAHGVYITDDMRNSVLDTFSAILTAVDVLEPPQLDIEAWTFNNFKTACALSLTDAELADIERQNDAIQSSTLPDAKKRHWDGAVADIRRLRKAVV